MSLHEATQTIDECYRCGYDLRGIASDQPCPECGLLAERSRRVSDELHDTRPRWLRRVTVAVWTILLALPLPIVWLPILGALQQQMIQLYISTGSRSNSNWMMIAQTSLPFVGFDVAAAMLVLGAFLLTTREGYLPADRADRKRRLALRIFSSVPLLVILAAQLANAWMWRAMLSGVYGSISPTFFVVLIILLIVGTTPLPLLLFYQLRSLAVRARSAHLAEHCKIVGIGASVSLLYVALVYLVFEYAEQLHLGNYWTTRSKVSLALVLIVTLLMTLFLLWSLYLLIRFAIAFWKASRQLKRKWKQHDRAMTA